MTSAAAVIGLTVDSVDVQDVDGIFLEVKRGIGEVPEVRGVDLIVPAYAGRIVRNRVADRLPIILEGWVRGVGTASGASGEDEDRADFATNRAALRVLFDPTADPVLLEATLEDGTTQSINARTLNIVYDQVVPSFARVNIEMESVDPDWVAGS